MKVKDFYKMPSVLCYIKIVSGQPQQRWLSFNFICKTIYHSHLKV